jgi:16S rRNA C967 or C1407 C5-methylase (RsmB/RsmF family)
MYKNNKKKNYNNIKNSSKLFKTKNLSNKDNKLKKENSKNNSNKNLNNKFYSEYEKKLEKEFGKDFLKKELELRKKIKDISYIRVNLSRTSNIYVENFLKKNRVKFNKTFLPNSYEIERSFFNLSSSLPNLLGEIYIQDLPSQFPINLINFERLKKINVENKRKVQILDMAASPGSKTTQLADLLEINNIDYEIIALEKNEIRILRLINNIQKQEFKNIKILNINALNFESNENFDLILLDAPCSGNLIDDFNWLNKRDFEGIKKLSILQKELLKKANSLLKEGAQLIYSTCSQEVEENEENIKFVLNNLKLKEDERKDFNINLNPIKRFNLKSSYRFNPIITKTSAFFASSLIKI